MASPTRAVVLRRNRRSPWVSGDSARSRAAGQARAGAAGSSAASPLPPRIGGDFSRRDSSRSAMLTSGVADPGIEERVGQVHDEIDHYEGQRGQQGEALHLLVVAGDDGVDAEGAEPRHGEKG